MGVKVPHGIPSREGGIFNLSKVDNQIVFFIPLHRNASKNVLIFLHYISESAASKMRRESTTMTKMYRLCIVIGLIAVTFAICARAGATLGEPADSVAADQKSLPASRRAKTIKIQSTYTVKEITSDSVALREYIAPSGIVFGIAWNGLVHPDLAPLLGSYAEEYKKALRETPRMRGRRSVQVKTNRAVVEKWGHMRNLQGRAYVPDLVPSGVTTNEIK